MKYFLDTEFIEGTQKTLFGNSKPTIDLISIGIVAEDGREYYAISKDFNLKEAWNRWEPTKEQSIRNNFEEKEYWTRDNVLKPIFKELYNWDAGNYFRNGTCYFGKTKGTIIKNNFTYKNLKTLINKYGKTNKQIAEEVKVFCTGDVLSIEKAKYYEVQHKPCKFYAYYADYDWVVFCWLFGKMIDLPNGFPMYCNDLKQELDTYIENKWLPDSIAYMKGINDNVTFDLALEKLQGLPEYPKQTNEHNALADAKWNYELYKFLNTI